MTPRSPAWLGVLGLVGFGAASTLAGERPPRAAAIAVVGSLTGSASISQGKSRKALALFDWIAEGSEIALATGSNLTLVFADGRRFVLGSASRVRVASAGPKLVAGILHALEPVPPFPRLGGIAPGARPGARSGALRLRGGGPAGLYPRAGVAALPDSTVLRIPLTEPGIMAVEIQDGDGRSIFQAETRAGCVPVPRGILEAGTWYRWELRGPKERGSFPVAEAEFHTLARDDLERRTALESRLENEGDAQALALMAAVDRRLGLLAEAREELAAALAKAPENAELLGALEDLDGEMGTAPCGPISTR